MTLDNTFGMTNDLSNMVKQYGLTSDLMKAGPGVRLRPSILKALQEEIIKFSGDSMDSLMQECVNQVEEDFRDLLRTYLGMSLNTFVLAKRPVASDGTDNQEDESSDDAVEDLLLNEESDDYIGMLFIDEVGSTEINLSQLGAAFRPGYDALIKEKPILCWILDTRSPFFNQDFAEQLKDLSVLMNFRGMIVTDVDLLNHMIVVLGSILRGDRH